MTPSSAAGGRSRNMLTYAGVCVVAAALTIEPTPVPAQWLKHPTPGIQRNADGQPNLSAPVPRAADGKPDLSGIWNWTPGRYLNIAADLKPGETQPWAEALVRQRTETLGRDDPSGLQCLPFGPRVNVSIRCNLPRSCRRRS